MPGATESCGRVGWAGRPAVAAGLAVADAAGRTRRVLANRTRRTCYPEGAPWSRTPHYHSALQRGKPREFAERWGNVLRRCQMRRDAGGSIEPGRDSLVNSRLAVRVRPSAPPPPGRERPPSREWLRPAVAQVA